MLSGFKIFKFTILIYSVVLAIFSWIIYSAIFLFTIGAIYSSDFSDDLLIGFVILLFYMALSIYLPFKIVRFIKKKLYMNK
jgi:hypothetical protein